MLARQVPYAGSRSVFRKMLVYVRNGWTVHLVLFNPAPDRISSVMHLYEHRLIPSASACMTAFQNSRPYAQPVLTDSYVLPFMAGTGFRDAGSRC